jgi:diguanylate cyclase (GGDEF)-like protein/hemerythrin-like metal-binding protein
VTPATRQLQWNSILDTGISVVDKQHRRLVEIFNQAATAQNEGATTEQTLGLLDALFDYTRQHFREEAQLMRKWKVHASHRGPHLQAHRRFVTFLVRMRVQASTHPAELAADLMNFLAQWLLHHIMGLDAAMARAIRAAKGEPAPALEAAPQDLTARQYLLDVMGQLTDALGRRTLDLLDQRQTLLAQRRNLLELQDLYRALLRSAAILIDSESEAEMLESLCETLTRDTPFQAAWIGRPGASRAFEILALRGFAAGQDKEPGLQARAVACMADRAWKTRQVVVCNDTQFEECLQPWHAQLRSQGWTSLLVAPVERGQDIWGLLMLVSARREAFDEGTIALCTRIAGLLGHGLGEFDRKERLRHMQRHEALAARTDVLTQLPNRFALQQHLPHTIRRARRQGTTLAVGVLDLDDFKPVNDRFGHATGDELLQQLVQRLRTTLRGTDYMARLGGDEFVLVFEDLDPAHAERQLAVVLHRLMQAIRNPFDLGPQRQARVGMTLGLALFPGDGEDADTLLRNADAAMYQAKARKSTRTQWWRLWGEGTLVESTVETPVDLFGEEVRQLLQALVPIVQEVAPEFAAQFYAELMCDAQQAAILDSLLPQELAHLQDKQAQHLQFLLHPDTTAEQINERAQLIGQVHALVGLSPAALLQATALYESLLRSRLENSALMAKTRYRLVRIIQARMAHHLRGEINAQQALLSTYHALLADPLPSFGRWIDLARSELDRIAALPGIRAVFIFRVNDSGQLRIELGAGPVAEQIQTGINGAGLHPTIHLGPNEQRGVMGQAWASATPQIVDSYLLDARLRPWQAMMLPLGVRSAAAIPILRATAAEAVLFILGAYPRQFSNPLLQTWISAQKNRWEQLQNAACAAPPPSDALHATKWRSLLYQGALRMVVQPIVDLRGGTVTKVESLARLQARDGTLVSPGMFLPAMGQDDLRILFRQGLEQSLSALRQWRKAGTAITLSLNLDPITLLDPDCPLWVERALCHADLPPDALTLELLETRDIDPRLADASIARLRATGVGLTMDDLGSGYSSMKRLMNLHFDVIKIDQAVVKDVFVHPLQGIALMRTVLQLGLDMGCAVVAEGLEDNALVEVAMLLGCAQGQGYALAMPMGTAAFAEWLGAHTPIPLPGGGELHSWLGATAYAWGKEGDIRVEPMRLDMCPLTRFLHRQGVRDGDALRWHALMHDSAFEQERTRARQSLLQWLQQQALTQH